ncbi:hypothetical protein JCM16303_002926 [Sporobolomyces ruberrimus]
MIRKGARPFHPPANRDSFKDLLIFEERLKQNAERLQKQRRKYQGFLVSLVAVILYLAYLVLVHPSIYSLVHYSNVACLLVAATTLILFFATGMYSDKIAYAYKFVPQANRALRPFNIYLNTRHKSRFSFLLNPFRSSPSNTSRSNSIASPSLSRTPSGRSISSPTPSNSSSREDLSSLSRQTSASSLRSQTSFRSTTALHSASPSPSVSPSSSPPSSPRPSTTPLPLPTSEGPVTRAPPVPSPPLSSSSTRTPGIPIPPIPPAQNPRGELIFSNRVNPTFREGYERYRGEWERRRKENKELENRAKNSTWWWKLSNWGSKNVSPRTTHGEQGTVGKEQNEGKERGRNSAESSQFNSRANSSERQPSSTTTTTTNARTAAEALLSTVSTPRTSSPNHSPRPASPSPVPSSTSLAPLDADDPSSTSTPPPQSAPHTLSPTTTNSTQSNGKGNSPNHSRIRAESFSELLELEAANEEENELGGVGGGGGVGPPELRRSSSFR